VTHSFYGRLDDVQGNAGYAEDHPPRMGFFTDTSVCIGCKACEVACKTWNQLPEDGISLSGMSYDNTLGLSSDTWRHVAFIEKPLNPTTTDLGLPGMGPPGWDSYESGLDTVQSGVAHGEDQAALSGDGSIRWLMSSDVCKHCTHAACLDVCPTGSLFRTEFGTVVVQPDICNGCGYCVSACPYGVIDLNEEDGRAFKCTLCYDRLKGVDVARLYGRDPEDGVGGDGAFFLLLDEPEVYGLPPDPVVTTRDIGSIWKHVGAAAATMVGLGVVSFVGRRR
jgi:formate dehydrogenase iron-sulfur subunit